MDEKTEARLIAELQQRFDRWWNDEGSGIAPHDGEEHCFHAERVARIAWLNGAFIRSTAQCATEPLTQHDPPATPPMQAG